MQLYKKPQNYKEPGVSRGEIQHVQYKVGYTGYHISARNEALRAQRMVTLPGEIIKDRNGGRKSFRQRE